MIFYRFGEIPEDACSSIWNNNNEVIGKEKGVSVYEAHKNINGTYSPVLPFPTNEMAFNDFIYNVKYFTGNKYLVTGDLLDETGTDGEPLIKNVKILKKIIVMETENINNYSEMSIEDLEKLKIKFLSQRNNLENTIGEIINNIRAKKIQVNNCALREHPYYKDNTSYLKVVINDGTGYTVTKITPGGKCIGIYQFNADNTSFLKYYKICSQSEWESAIDRLNIWFKDASLKIKKL